MYDNDKVFWRETDMTVGVDQNPIREIGQIKTSTYIEYSFDFEANRCFELASERLIEEMSV